MAQLLNSAGYRVHYLLGARATRDNILDELIAASQEVHPDGLLLFYFSGHGGIHAFPRMPATAYLIPADTDPTRIYSSGILLNRLAENYLGGVRDTVCIFDCCYAGKAITPRAHAIPDPDPATTFQHEAEERLRSRNHAVLAACSPDQKAFEANGHGVFTASIVEFWQQTPGLITALDLCQHVQRAMAAFPAQRPAVHVTELEPIILRPAPREDIITQDPPPDANNPLGCLVAIVVVLLLGWWGWSSNGQPGRAGQATPTLGSYAIAPADVKEINLMPGFEGLRGFSLTLAFAPDSQTMAMGSGDGHIWLRPLTTTTATAWPATTLKAISQLAFAPDGQILAAASWDKTIALWRVADGHRLRILTGHTGAVVSIAFAPDGQSLISGSDDGTVAIWRVGDGMRLNSLEAYTNKVTGAIVKVTGVAFAPDGHAFASTSEDVGVRLWAPDMHPLKPPLATPQRIANTVAFAPGSQMLAAGTADGSVELWNTADGTLQTTFTDLHQKVISLAYSPDGQLLVAGADDGTIELWSVADGQALRSLHCTDHILSVAFSPNGEILGAGGLPKNKQLPGTVCLWHRPH